MSSVDHIAIWQVACWTKMSHNQNYGGSLQNGHLRRQATTCSTVMTENYEKENIEGQKIEIINSAYTVGTPNAYFDKNMLLLKNPQYLPDHYETLTQ